MKIVRMIKVTVPIDKIPEVTRIYEESIVPALKPVAGFLGAFLCTEPVPVTGEGFSLTFWASEKDALAYEQSGLYAKLLEKLRPFFVKQPILTTYNVPVETPFPVSSLR